MKTLLKAHVLLFCTALLGGCGAADGVVVFTLEFEDNTHLATRLEVTVTANSSKEQRAYEELTDFSKWFQDDHRSSFAFVSVREERIDLNFKGYTLGTKVFEKNVMSVLVMPGEVGHQVVTFTK